MKVLLIGLVMALTVEGLRLSRKVEEVPLPGANLPEDLLLQDGNGAYVVHPADAEALMELSNTLQGEVKAHLALAKKAGDRDDLEGAAEEHVAARHKMKKLRAVEKMLARLEDRKTRARDQTLLALDQREGSSASKVRVFEGKNQEIHPDEYGRYHLRYGKGLISPAVDRAVAPAARKIFRSFLRWFEKVYLIPRGNGGGAGGCFGMDCKAFGRPNGMHSSF